MYKMYRLSIALTALVVLPGCCLFGLDAEFAAGPRLGPAVAPAQPATLQPAGLPLPTPQASTAGAKVGAGGVILSADGHSEFGVEAFCDCALPSTPGLSYGGGVNMFFPENQTWLGGWFGAKYDLTSGRPVGIYGTANAVWSYASYDSGGYTVPDFSRVGGLFQEFGSSENAFGVRPGIGAEYDSGPDSRFVPFAEVGYDVFLVGADFGNELRLSAGGALKLGND